MTAPYDLSRLGSDRFEHLVQALTIDALGVGVQVFGAGPDGGREATFDGPVTLEGKPAWNGYGVIQAKYKSTLHGPELDQQWFFSELTKEMDRWKNSKKRHRKPQYFVIVTNVPLSAVSREGGLDRFNRLMLEYQEDDLPELQDWDVWAGDRVCRLLERADGIRRSYADLVLPGDVLSRLHDMLTERDAAMEQALIAYLARTLAADQNVELGESGDSANTPLPLIDVAVDLPVEGTADHAIQRLVGMAENVLAPSLMPRVFNRVVLLGGPGSGKSTLSKLLAQIYRVGMLVSVGPGHITDTTAAMTEVLGRSLSAGDFPPPTLHRFPVRVVLSQYADEISGGSDRTLLRHITDRINDRWSAPLDVATVKRLLVTWPSLIILDGLDEVPTTDLRHEVSRRTSDFLTEMAAMQADTFLVCTSRPIGFDDQDVQYQPLPLARLSAEQAIRYADRFLEQRHPHDPARQDEVRDRLQKAAADGDTTRLMDTPLQVTIMSILLERRTRAPSSRFGLFDAYYTTIYAREQDKAGWIGEFLEAHRPKIDMLHERAGLTIHRRAERGGDAESILPADELNKLARDILEGEGYTATQVTDYVERIVTLTRERLVLMVPRGDGVAFEVRSLAEFFSARAHAAREDLVDRLERMTSSVHWRNTWLLAAGLVFAERHDLRDAVVAMLDRLDESTWAAMLVNPGALVATSALADGFATHAPKYEHQLATSAMRLLDGPIDPDITALASTLHGRMEESTELRKIVFMQVDRRLLAGRSPGTKTFLTGLAASGAGSVAATATLKLTKFAEMSAITPVSDNPSTDLAAIRNLVIAGGAPVELLNDKGNKANWLRHATDENGKPEWVVNARETAAEACVGRTDDISLTIRRVIRDGMQRDAVSGSF